MLVNTVREGLHEHLARLKKERVPDDDLAAGRRFVAAYVPFVHWAEGVHAAATGGGHAGHAAAAPAAGGHEGHGAKARSEHAKPAEHAEAHGGSHRH